MYQRIVSLTYHLCRFEQIKSHQTIYKDTVNDPSVFWEHESIANYYGDQYFKHPDCATQNILKTEALFKDSNSTKLKVTAHGYREEERITTVEVYGNDGKYHNINVHWIKYIPVENTTMIAIKEGSMPNVKKENGDSLLHRRSIYSYIMN